MYTEKERNLLKDLKEDEALCVEKYQKYSASATNPQLQDLMGRLEKQEEEHLETISKLMNGNVPTVSSGSMPSPASKAVKEFTATSANYSNGSSDFQNDKYICTDALGTEKHVSSVYNTSLFEFKNKEVRDALNHIQKEEQDHGEKIYNYMSQNGMYN